MANLGHQYEHSLVKKLQSEGWTPHTFNSGGNTVGPDVLIHRKCGNNILNFKVEAKNNLLRADFGQTSLQYDININSDNWKLIGRDRKESVLLREELKKCGIEEYVNEKWGPCGPPSKTLAKFIKRAFNEKDYEYDSANFVDIFMDVPVEIVHNYYAAKDTHYIQIQGFGLYSLGSDPLNLKVPQFDCKIQARIRRKNSGNSLGKHNYRFAVGLVVNKDSEPLIVSPLNLDGNTDFLWTCGK